MGLKPRKLIFSNVAAKEEHVRVLGGDSWQMYFSSLSFLLARNQK